MARKPRLGWLAVGLCCGWSVLANLTVLAADRQPALGATLRPAPAEVWTPDRAKHLLSRAGFGGNAEEVQKLFELGPLEAVNRLVDYHAQPAIDLAEPSAKERVEPLRNLAKLSPEERQKANQERRRDDQQRLNGLRAWWVRRMIQSPRPLEEKMTLFWHGLLTSGYQTIRSARAMYEQNELFRRHASGNYGQLLHAIVRDPAMLRYLDNNSNVKGRPNENLAREILELFSLGEGNYTEQDIKEGARALTGYTYDREMGEFRFVERSHDTGEKTIFGQTGNWDGDKLVELILQQPATARYITRKLFVFFVHDQPDERTIDDLARIFRDGDYEIAPVLKAMFLSEEFYSDRAVAKHIKSPVELVVGMIRSLPVNDVDYQALAAAMRAMGQDLFEPPNVKGWDGGHAWLNSNSLFTRQNFAVALINGGGPGRFAANGGKRRGSDKVIDLAAVCQRNCVEKPEDIVAFFSRSLFAVPLNQNERSELLAVLGELPAMSQWSSQEAEINRRLRKLVTLMLSMPQYQLS